MENNFEYEINNVDEIVTIKLKGYLDATHAYSFMDELKKLIGTPVKEIKYMVEDLEYISSAGLRAMVFSKQKIGYDSTVFLYSPQE